MLPSPSVCLGALAAIFSLVLATRTCHRFCSVLCATNIPDFFSARKRDLVTGLSVMVYLSGWGRETSKGGEGWKEKGNIMFHLCNISPHYFTDRKRQLKGRNIAFYYHWTQSLPTETHNEQSAVNRNTIRTLLS